MTILLTAQDNINNLVDQYGLDTIRKAIKEIEDRDKPKLNALKEFDRIVVYGRRWFNSREGNTYHSVVVYVDGELIGQTNLEYGYGDCYKQTAHSLLVKAGYYKDEKLDDVTVKGYRRSYNLMLEDSMNYRNRFDFQVIDVQRKKDL